MKARAGFDRIAAAISGRRRLSARASLRGLPSLRGRSPRARWLTAGFALLGPGLIAANAGNDAGGIATYSQVGARYGFKLLWVMLLITISLALVQSLAARMGAVTGKGLAELVRENYGIRWSVFATSAVVIANVGICISDFAGVGAALGLAGISVYISVPITAVAIWLIIVRGSYRSAERVFILLTIPFFAYPIAAILSHPDWGAASKGLLIPQIQTNSAFLLLLVATAGTTITPYMQLYLQSAVVDRGVRIDEIGGEQRQAISGAVFANMIACFIIVATGATLYASGIHSVSSASDAASALAPIAGKYAEVLFAVGLLGASLLACAILPIATSYVVSESLGFEKGLSHRAGEAPIFVGIITAMIVVAAIVAMIPGIPLISLLVGVQVVNGILLPINLFFIWRLARNRRIMGEHRNKGTLDGLAAVTVFSTSLLSIALVVVTLFGL